MNIIFFKKKYICTRIVHFVTHVKYIKFYEESIFVPGLHVIIGIF